MEVLAVDVSIIASIPIRKKLRRIEATEKLKEMIKSAEEAYAKKYEELQQAENTLTKADGFIQNIYEDIMDVLKIKYSGYEEDIKALYSLALEYIQAKKDFGEISGPNVLAWNPMFLKRLNNLEAEINKSKRLKVNEDNNKNLLDQARMRISSDIVLAASTSTEQTYMEDISEPTLVLKPNVRSNINKKI